MKKLAYFATALLGASAAVAGGIEEQTVEAVEMVEETSSSAGWIVPLVAIALVALAIANDDDSDVPG